jgi:RNA polymerase sigma-70 factor (ECF subfamily)
VIFFIFFSLPVENGQKYAESIAEVFARLYSEYLPKVYRFIRYRIEDNDTAEDLTSVVFEKALAKFHVYESQRATFSTWVFTIARNTVIDYFRVSHKDRFVPLSDDDPQSFPDSSPEDVVIKSEEFSRLQLYIRRLSQPEQSVISLKFGAHMTNRDIAKTMGMTESQIGNMVFRSVRRLRDNFRGWRDE